MKLPLARGEHDGLLRAVLAARDQEVRDAWREWIGRIRLESLGHSSRQLLPLLYFRARRAGVVEDEFSPKFRGFCRYAWTRTQTLSARAIPALRALEEAGIEFLLIRGAALLSLAYAGNSQLRPLVDLDVLVRPADAERAAGILPSTGWMSSAPHIDDARTFVHADGLRLRLYTRSLMEGAERDIADAAWDAPVKVEFGGQLEVRVPDPTTTMFHAGVYGLFHPLPPPIRWIADVAHLHRARGAEVDWSRIQWLAAETRTLPHWRLARQCLLPFMAVPEFPNRPPLSDRAAFVVAFRGQVWAGQTPRWWLHARRMGVPFGRYLKNVFGVARGRDLFGIVVQEAWNRWMRILKVRRH